jgi:ribonuclease Z
VYFPAGGLTYVERLRRAAVFDEWTHLRLHPVPCEDVVLEASGFRLVAAPLDHTTDTLGWRVEEPVKRHVLVDRAARLGITGPGIGQLVRAGAVDTPDGRVTLEEVSEPRAGQRFAFVMDTAPCDAAIGLASSADLVVCESTFLQSEADLARQYRHLTARQAAWIAAEAGARRLVLTHFSQRYPDADRFTAEAGAVFPDVSAVHDLSTVAVPARREDDAHS